MINIFDYIICKIVFIFHNFQFLFKESFTALLSAYALEYDFAELMHMASVEHPQPKVGMILDYEINLYF